MADGSAIPGPLRAAVRYAADRVPLAVVSGAAREEIVPAIAAAGLDDVLDLSWPTTTCASGSRIRSRTCSRSRRSASTASDALVFEDTEAGVAAAKAAGLRG